MPSPSPINASHVLDHAEWLSALARSLVSDAADADDLAQDTWLALSKNPVPRGVHPRAWLTAVLRNLRLMRARSLSRRLARETTDPESVPSAAVLLERLELHRRLADLVAALPEPERTVVLLRHSEGLSSSQIAEQLGIPAGTVRWRLKNALDQLRERLDASTEGGRVRWSALVVPSARGEGWLLEAAFMKGAQGFGAALAVLLALLGGWWLLRPSSPPPSPPAAVTPSQQDERTRANSDGTSTSGTTRLPSWLGQPEVAPRRVAGVVLFSGKPVAGARVRLEPSEMPGTNAASERLTDAQGHFDFGPQRPMPHTVSASAPERTAAVKELDLRQPGDDVEHLSLELTGCVARVEGRVLDSAGGPIASAHVRIARASGVLTNESGAFELCTPPGPVSLHADADGYGAIEVSVAVFGKLRRDLVLIPSAMLRGRVVDASTGAPVADALVTARPSQYGGSDALRGAMALSGADGRWSVEVSPGNYRIEAQHEAARTRFPTFLTTIVGQLSDEVRLELVGQPVVTGIVRENGKPIAGAKVGVFATAGNARGFAVSQADGRYVLVGAPRGEVVFTASPWAVDGPKRRVLSAAREEVDLSVHAQAAIEGVVTKEGKPVPGAKVTVSAGVLDLSDFSDARGYYRVSGIAPGRYRVIGYSAQEGGFTERSGVIVKDRADVKIDLELNFAANISGQVVDEHGAPVADAMVLYANDDDSDEGRCTTDADGRFRCAEMTGGGAYTPQVFTSPQSRAPFAPAKGKPFERVLLADGSSRVEGVVLTVDATRKWLEGRTVDAQGNPVPDVVIRAEAGTAANFSPFVALPRTVSDPQGRFRIEGLGAGTWSVHARAPDGAEATVTGLEAGGPSRDVVMRAASGVEGTLVGYEEPPAGIFARMPKEVRLIHGQLDGSRFQVKLPPGTWIISALNSREGDVQRVVVEEGKKTQLTMKSRGRARVTGRITDFMTGAPVEGLWCHAVLVTDGLSGSAHWDLETAPRTDANGEFVMDPAPSGDLYVMCGADWNEVSLASGLVKLERGQDGKLTLAVVRRVPGQPRGDVGIGFDDPLRTPCIGFPVVTQVRPDGPGAKTGVRLGDRVVAVDGRDVSTLDASGVEYLLTNHPPKTSVAVTLARGTQRLDVTLIAD